jgi:ElaB/YqjD/DUF883 family membrane-anchored ribosome-binding protein
MPNGTSKKTTRIDINMNTPIGEILPELLRRLKTSVTDFFSEDKWKAIKQDIHKKIETMINKCEDLSKNVSEYSSEKTAAAKTKITSAMKSIRTTFGKITKKLGDWCKKSGQALSSALNSAVEGVSNAINTIQAKFFGEDQSQQLS